MEFGSASSYGVQSGEPATRAYRIRFLYGVSGCPWVTSKGEPAPLLPTQFNLPLVSIKK